MGKDQKPSPTERDKFVEGLDNLNNLFLLTKAINWLLVIHQIIYTMQITQRRQYKPNIYG
jgi:hypothetical protein